MLGTCWVSVPPALLRIFTYLLYSNAPLGFCPAYVCFWLLGKDRKPRGAKTWMRTPELYLQFSLRSISLTGFLGAEFVLPGCPSCQLPPLLCTWVPVSRHPFLTCRGQTTGRGGQWFPTLTPRPPHATVMPSNVHFNSAVCSDSKHYHVSLPHVLFLLLFLLPSFSPTFPPPLSFPSSSFPFSLSSFFSLGLICSSS